MGKSPTLKSFKRKNRSTWLIGGFIEKITGSKLPSNRQVLGNFLYHHHVENHVLHKSATNTANQILEFWGKARIPTREKYHIINKIKKYHEKWVNLKKSKSRLTETQQKSECEFSKALNNLFDVSHSNAMSLIEIAEDRDFLLAQREEGRKGTMGQVDCLLHRKEKRKLVQEVKILERQQKEKERVLVMSQSVELDDSDKENENVSDDDGEIFFSPQNRVQSKPIRVMTPDISNTFDRAGISDSKAMFVLATTFKSIGVKGEEIRLSESTIRRARRQNRQAIANEIKKTFNPNSPLTVHWDSKLIPSMTGKKSDRLAVIVTGENGEKLLGVPDTQVGTGLAQSSAVYKLLSDWNLVDNVTSMSFDTTATNTGIRNGACVLLEELVNKKLLHLACRHHVMELIVGKVFETLFGSSTAPTIPLFQKFAMFWTNIIQNGLQDRYSSGMVDKEIKRHLEPVKKELVHFIKSQLDENQPRHDYKELLELSALFLGENLDGWVTIHSPGACHRARWMSKVIYCLKIFLFRQHFSLTDVELSSLREFNIFVVKVYLKSWFTAQCSTSAPRHDLDLLKRIVEYKVTNAAVSKAAFDSFSGHLWYVSESLIGLSFFDSGVSNEIKRKLVKGLQRKGVENPLNRIQLEETSIKRKQLHQFVTHNTYSFFASMNIDVRFLRTDPTLWENNQDYLKAKERVKKLKVVNDCAERAVALIQSFDSILTSQEEQKQYLLQVVENHRKLFPTSKKSVLMS